MKSAGMKQTSNGPVEVDGISMAGGEDPLITNLGNPTEVRDNTDLTTDNVEADLGNSLYSQALRKDIDIIGPHEGYAVGAFMGMESVTQSSMSRWFENAGSNTVPYEDGVRDLPTSLLVYGHWHRIVQPRTVWNSDGSWTLVMELNTMGGTIGNPTITKFSSPNDAPQQTASFPIVFMDNETKLVSGYQMYSFEPNGQLTISDFVPIGLPGGKPDPALLSPSHIQVNQPEKGSSLELSAKTTWQK